MARLRRLPTAVAQPTPASGTSNHLTAAIAALETKEKRRAVLDATHPLYTEHETERRVLLDAYEGAGGFLTGDYLWQFPNEDEGDIKARRAQARFHNYVRELVNIYVRHVMREGLKRDAKGNAELEAWWTNVDDAGTPIDRFMKRAARLALATGHMAILVDKTPDPPTGPAKSDDRGRVIAAAFHANQVRDWRLEREKVVGIKLLEGVSSTSILDPIPTGEEAKRYLLWDLNGWARFDGNGHVIEASAPGTPGLGLVPVAMVRPDPSAEHPFIGHPLVGNGNVQKALYNRCSEEDEVLRNQAFSTVVVHVDEKADVQQTKTDIGNSVGSSRVVVAKGDVKYITADMAAPAQIRENILFLVREIYRMAHVKYERDSLDAESAEAIRLQHTELNEMLVNVADELQKAELAMVRFWFHWMFPSVDQAEAAFTAAKISITYPREFFITDLLVELEKWAKGIALDLGVEFEHFAKKRAIDQLAPDVDQATRDKMHDEIDAQASQRETRLEEAQARLTLATDTRFGKKEPEPKAA